MANSEDPDNKVAGISSESALFAKKKKDVQRKNVTPQYIQMDRPDLNVSNFMENYIGLKRVKKQMGQLEKS